MVPALSAVVPFFTIFQQDDSARPLSRAQFHIYQEHQSTTFKIGDEVTLRTRNFKLARTCRKLADAQIAADTVIDT